MTKKLILFISFIFTLPAFSQTPRLSLFEEFTGETCPPCAATNPGLNAVLANPINQAKVVAIKWQVPIPSAPSNTWSLYQTNKTEIDWRYGPSGNGYGYQSQWTSGSAPSSGINSAPTGLIDGQHLWQFGAPNDHAGSLSNAVINSAQSFTSAFSVTLNREWNPTYTAVTLTVNIQASAIYTTNSNLVFRLVMIERHIHFPTQPGTNGEKDFEDVARQSFPSIQAGTAMAPTWTVGQSQTFTINCAIPSSILNKAEVAFVGFIQNDGNRKIEQAVLADAVGQNDDARAESVFIPDVVCTSTLSPVITIKNHGDNTINTLTITPYLDGVASTSYTWSGTLGVGALTTLTLNTISATAGTHTYSYTISAVNGGPDSYDGNNSMSYKFISSPAYIANTVVESFSLGTFPPANWALINRDNGIYSWSRNSSVGAYGSNSGAAKYDFFNNSALGDVDDLYLAPTDLTGILSPSLTFDVAYAEYPGGYMDKLEVLVSSNCGGNWTTVYSKAAPSLSTAPATTSDFFPTANQWRNEVISLASFTATPKILVKFRAINGNGNNVWVDNVNLGEIIVNTTGTEKVNSLFSFNLMVYPNPAKETINLTIDTDRAVKAITSVINMFGQIVYSTQNNFEVGINNFAIDARNLPNSVYTLLVEAGEKTLIKKLIVNK